MYPRAESRIRLLLTIALMGAIVVFALAVFSRLAPFRGQYTLPGGTSPAPLAESPAADADQTTAEQPDDPFTARRQRMVKLDLAGRDIKDRRVLDAMRKVPRHLFTPAQHRDRAYADHPLPIGHNQTISQPYVVALMTQLAQPTAKSRALDVGTGSGYQAAVLAELVDKVYSIEIVRPLAEEASQRLKTLGYKNVEVKFGDGYRGWPQHAPFDVIIVAAAPDHIPKPLIEQLAPGGHLIIPVGRFFQNLIVVEKKANGQIVKRNVGGVAFVPMTGEAQQGRGKK